MIFADLALSLFGAWMNIQKFLVNFFSLPLLARSFFAPFRKMQEKKAPGFNPENIAEVFVANLVSRFVGMLVRGILIVLGIITEAVVFVVGFIFYLTAIFSPIFVPASILLGIFLIISSL